MKKIQVSSIYYKTLTNSFNSYSIVEGKEIRRYYYTFPRKTFCVTRKLGSINSEDWVYDIFFNIKHIGNKNRRLFNEKRTNRVPINQFFRN